MAALAAQLLDELMGRNRNALPAEGNKDLTWEDPDVCKYFLCGFCPHELFVNTRADLGHCDKIHDDAIKKNYEENIRFERMGYEEDFLRYLQSLLSDVERRIKKGQARLALNNQQGMLANRGPQRDDKIRMLTEKINELVNQAEELGCEGKVEEAQGVLKLCEQLREERQQLEEVNNLEDPNGLAAKEMEVCNICGAFLVVGDAPQRVEEHILGKQHAGYARVKAMAEKLEMRIKSPDFGRSKDAKPEKEREDKDGDKERPRRSEDRDRKSRQRSRSGDRGRGDRDRGDRDGADRDRGDRGDRDRGDRGDRGRGDRDRGDRVDRDRDRGDRDRDRDRSRRSREGDRRSYRDDRDRDRDRRDRDRDRDRRDRRRSRSRERRGSRDRSSREEPRGRDRDRSGREDRRSRDKERKEEKRGEQEDKKGEEEKRGEQAEKRGDEEKTGEQQEKRGDEEKTGEQAEKEVAPVHVAGGTESEEMPHVADGGENLPEPVVDGESFPESQQQEEQPEEVSVPMDHEQVQDE